MAKKPGFMIYTEWEKALLMLSGPALKELLHAMFHHTKTREVLQLKNSNAQYAWNLMQGRMDYDTQRYEKATEQRREAANARWARERAAEEGCHPGSQSDHAISWDQDGRNANYLKYLDRLET